MCNWMWLADRAARRGYVLLIAAAACGGGTTPAEPDERPSVLSPTERPAQDVRANAAGAPAPADHGTLHTPAAPSDASPATPSDLAAMSGKAAPGMASPAPPAPNPAPASNSAPAGGPDAGGWGSSDWNGVGHAGTPASAASLPPGTQCEEFSHVSHLPWDNRPPECATGDYCLKWDGDPNEQFPNGPEDVIPNGKTWFANANAAFAGPLGGLAKIAIVSCKIGNQCLRFYGQNNCHYDLYDPDTNMTVKPPYMGGGDVPYAIKDGHDYLNFRVRLPGGDTVYNFTNVEANAAASPYYARYCPSDAARKSVVGSFDPLEGNQALGCGPDSGYHAVAALVGETRQPLPYPPPGRSEYDWTYEQPGPTDPLDE